MNELQLHKHLQKHNIRKEDIEIIQLTAGEHFAILDKGSEQAKYKWNPSVSKLIIGEPLVYCQRREGKKILLLHREITGCPKGLQVHHKNGCCCDNRRSNLDIVTSQQNLQAKRMRKNKWGFKGLSSKPSKTKGRRYYASIHLNGKQIWLGTHDTPEEAAKSYNRAALLYFKTYAELNVINERRIS